MLVTADDMKKAFDPVVNEVINLVKHQIENIKSEKDGKKGGEDDEDEKDDEDKGEGGDRKVSAVLLVGGFGESRYLQKRLEEAIAPIELLCPPNGYVQVLLFITSAENSSMIMTLHGYVSWSAIARGAVIKGIAARSTDPTWVVASRKAKEHYGIKMRAKFKPHHDPAKK